MSFLTVTASQIILPELYITSEEEEGEKKKEEKEGIQLVTAVIDFVKDLEPEIKMNISSNVSTIVKQVKQCLLFSREVL